MAEKENVVVEEQQTTPTETAVAETAVAASETKKVSFGAKVKEWFRKQAVTLKRKPQRIAFLFFIISGILLQQHKQIQTCRTKILKFLMK